MVHLYFSESVELIEQDDKLWINTKDGCILRIQGLKSGNCVSESGVNAQDHYMLDIKIFPKQDESERLQKVRKQLEDCLAAWEQLCPCADKMGIIDLDEDTLEEAIARGNKPEIVLTEAIQELISCPDCGEPIPKEEVENLRWHCPKCGWD